MNIVTPRNAKAIIVFNVVIAFAWESVTLLELYLKGLEDCAHLHIVDKAGVARYTRLLTYSAKENDFVLGEGYTAHHSAFSGYLILDQIVDEIHFKDWAILLGG